MNPVHRVLLGDPLVALKIAEGLDRASLGALYCTCRGLKNAISTRPQLFDKWPAFDSLVQPNLETDVVHISKSPDGTKLSIVTRYRDDTGIMVTYDRKIGQFDETNVNPKFCPCYSHDGKFIITGAPIGRGIVVGLLFDDDGFPGIHWNNPVFTDFQLTGATFAGNHAVYTSHISTISQGALRLCNDFIYGFFVQENPELPREIWVGRLQEMQIDRFDVGQRADTQYHVNVQHKYPYTAVNIFDTYTSKIFLCQHMDANFDFDINWHFYGRQRCTVTVIPMNPRLDVDVGLQMSLAFASSSLALVGVACDASYGRIITYFNAVNNHLANAGPVQNFSRILNYFAEEDDRPKIWYYDGGTLIISVHQPSEFDDEDNESELEHSNRMWNESRLSRPYMFKIKDKVPNLVRDLIDAGERIVTDNVQNRIVPLTDYYEWCTVNPTDSGLTPYIWHTILNK